MHIAGSSKVKDKDGLWGTVVPGSPPLPSNAAQVVVQTESGQQSWCQPSCWSSNRMGAMPCLSVWQSLSTLAASPGAPGRAHGGACAGGRA